MLTVLITVYIVLMLILFLAQRSLLYYPTSAPLGDTGTSISLNSNGIELRIETANDSAQSAILYFGGNAESAIQSIQHMQPVLGDNALYFMNYRGYGGSLSNPTESGLYQDALALYDYAAQRHKHIRLIGRSLGTGVVTYVASQRQVEQIILISPYDSITAVAASHYPIFPIKWLIKDKYDSYNRAHQIACPSLILAAREDRVVPLKHTLRLIDAMTASQKTVRLFDGVDHNSLDMASGFNRAISDFIAPR
ncbi:MAG: alpha/beta hydrolase [Aestuariibacter sp.]